MTLTRLLVPIWLRSVPHRMRAHAAAMHPTNRAKYSTLRGHPACHVASALHEIMRTVDSTSPTPMTCLGSLQERLRREMIAQVAQARPTNTQERSSLEGTSWDVGDCHWDPIEPTQSNIAAKPRYPTFKRKIVPRWELFGVSVSSWCVLTRLAPLGY